MKTCKSRKQLSHSAASFQVTLKLQSDEIERLKSVVLRQQQQAGGSTSTWADADSTRDVSKISSELPTLTYFKRLELMKPAQVEQQRYCRVMTYVPDLAMLVVSQPSFTVLAPGFGARRINMFGGGKVGSFVQLHKEPIRDLAVHPLRQELLLSAAQVSHHTIISFYAWLSPINFK
jgi:hypothetical protein